MARPDRLAALLSRTAEAHHGAFAATDGVDPEWPLWYARYLLENGFEQVVHYTAISVSELAKLLKEADRRHQAEAPDSPWVPYYVNAIVACIPKSGE